MDRSNAIISVIIPLFNKEKAIRTTILSVLNQSVTDFELIVVDDGSKDNSYQVVKSIQDPRINLIHKENGGVSSARNVGIRAAHSDYIALLDGDDFWEPTFLEEQMQLIKDFPNAAMWGVNYAFIKGDTCTPCNQGMGMGFRGYIENYWGTSHNDLFCSNSVVIRKDVLYTVGLYDERIHYSEDLDMWYRIMLKFPVVYYDKVLSYYNQNAENRCAYDLGLHHDLRKCFEYYIGKYQDSFQENRLASSYICSQVAATILLENYYFGNKQDRNASDKMINDLMYEDIHPKYRWIFKTPRCIGWVVYKIVCLKKSLVG